MRKFLYFDVEYANSKNKSLCQIGLMSEDFDTQNPIYPELNLYVNPDDTFDINCVSVHKITKDKVAGCDTFEVIWKKIEPYFVKAVIVGHNVKSSDLDALVKNLRRYNLDIPEMYYLDTYSLAQMFVPSFLTKDYKLSSLCSSFGIDIDTEHDAFDDACACADLLRALIEEYDINIDNFIMKYIPEETKEFSKHLNSSALRRELNQLFGRLVAIGMDNVISSEEVNYLKEWCNEYKEYTGDAEIIELVNIISNVTADNIITEEEYKRICFYLNNYVDKTNGSLETLATQQLQGIFEGILKDGEIAELEIQGLREWLYHNKYLEGHYPYDTIVNKISDILSDNIITQQERLELNEMMSALFNPLKEIKKALVKFEGSSFCLSGDFNFGSKSEVAKHIENLGGIIHSSVKKTTSYVVVGGCGSDAYSNGSYGTKVKKALELGIVVLKENDIFNV